MGQTVVSSGSYGDESMEMRATVRSVLAATVAVMALLGCQSDDGPVGGTTAEPEPSGATEEAPPNVTEAAPETEAAPRS